ncbi:hypothetical protein ASG43_18850 [Aureimonas sp. Leaf454]|uniref:hypothetical protein n=1 Tax=Aureimonas sp. Leaf454 TaxID=1736381 RepID=UPI0006FC6DE3|nr:hypothetical protein [Aureimonas sp. Leaf454]KQT53280.1 hypothetical protein ASG43_18850 [Aureimonas sp. Leaf454]
MFELPPLDQLALGALVVGVLFCVRLLLAVRRLRGESEGRGGFSLGDLRRIRTAHSYGASLEPNRRYALRQFVTACVLLAIALLLFVWLLLAGSVGPLVAGPETTP